MTNTTDATETTAATRAALRRYLDALAAGDLPTIVDCFAEDATWTIHGALPLSGTYRGRDAIIAFLTAAGGLYAPGTQRFAWGDTIVEGERAVLEWSVTGVGAATGEPYDNDYCGVFLYRDGRIAAVREFFDSHHVSRVLYA